MEETGGRSTTGTNLRSRTQIMKKAIILGINGMDAKTLSSILLKKGYHVVGTYRRNTLDIGSDVVRYIDSKYHGNISFSFCDVNDFNSVKFLIEKHPDVDEIYCLAAQSHVGLSFDSPNISGMNGMSVYNVLENVSNINKEIKVYFAATSELFGGKGAPASGYNESCEFDCRSPYSIGKEMGTRWVKYYRQLGLFCCYGILFNHSNEYRGLDFFIRRVTNNAAKIAIGKEKKLKLGNLNFFRDEHFSDFGCEMMYKMLQRKTPKDYVIATGEAYSGEEYLFYAFNHFNLDWKKYVEVDKTRFRKNEVDKLVGDSSLAQSELGWRPNRMSFSDHIKIMCSWDYKLEMGADAMKKPDIFELYP